MNKKLEFIGAIAEKKKFPVHSCGFCDYQCGFIYLDDEVKYDHGCDCVKYTHIRDLEEGEIDRYLNDENWQHKIEDFINE